MTKDPKSRFTQAQAEIDLGLNGLLGELGSALSDVLSRLDEAGAGEVHHEQTFNSPRGPIRASAGIRVRPLGGAPARAEGRRPDRPVTPPPPAPETAAAPPPPPAPRPISATILETEQGWTLVAELPGVSPDQVSLAQEGADLILTATGRGRAFEGRFPLPDGRGPDDLTLTMQNGILEITAPPKGTAP